MGLFGRPVMRQGATGIETGDGGEAQGDEVGSRRACLGQPLVHGQLGEPLATGQGCFEAGEEDAQGRTILFHGRAHLGRLLGGLARLEQGRRIDLLAPLDALGRRLDQPQGDPRGVHQQAATDRQPGQFGGGLAVVGQGHAIRHQGRTDLGRHLGRVDEQLAAVLTQQQMSEEHRVVGHVRATQVEQPGDVVQGGDEMPGGASVGHGLAHLGKLGAARLGRMGCGVGIDWRHRQLGALAPDRCQRIAVGAQLDALGLQGPAQGGGGTEGQHLAVHQHRATLGHLVGQPLQVGLGLAGDLLHQVDAAARQLLGGLLPVAAVGPDAGGMPGHQQQAGRAGEAGQPGTALPVFGQVFGQVGIGAGDQAGIGALFGQEGTQAGKSLSGSGGHEHLDKVRDSVCRRYKKAAPRGCG